MHEDFRFEPNPGHRAELVAVGLMFTDEPSIDRYTFLSRIETQNQLEAAFLALYQEMGTKATIASVLPYDLIYLPEQLEAAESLEQVLNVFEEIENIMRRFEYCLKHARIMEQFLYELESLVENAEGSFVITEVIKDYLVVIWQNYDLIERELINKQETVLLTLLESLRLAQQKAERFTDHSE